MGSQASGADARGDALAVMEALRRVVRFLRLADRRAEGAVGLSAAQMFVVTALEAAPATSMSDLAARTLTDQSSVSTVVARLVERGLVARRRASGDKRRVELALTARGRDVAARAPELAQVRIVRALEAMPRDERRALVAALGRFVTAIGADQLAPRMLFEDEPASPRRPRARR